MGFPGSSADKESACNVEDVGLIPGLGRSPGEGNGYPLQYSCLENSMDRGANLTRNYQISLQNLFSNFTNTKASCSSPAEEIVSEGRTLEGKE